MLKWLDAKAAQAQADRAVEEIERLVPCGELDGNSGARKKQIAKLDQTITRHRHEAAMAKYNVYQKAKFANQSNGACMTTTIQTISSTR